VTSLVVDFLYECDSPGFSNSSSNLLLVPHAHTSSGRVEEDREKSCSASLKLHYISSPPDTQCLERMTNAVILKKKPLSGIE